MSREGQPIPEAPIIVWFRRDLRLADHAALIAAEAAGAPILPLYILDDETPGRFRAGGASRWWLHGSLEALDGALAKLGGSLVLRKGAAPSVLDALLAETGAAAIFATRGYEPWEAELEQDIAKLCAARSAELRLFPGRVLFEPEAIRTKDGKPFRVFTPFWKACLAAPPPRAPLPAPKHLKFAAARSEKLASWKLLPTRPDWAGGLRAAWQPGESAARERLEQFVDNGLARYADDRNLIDDTTTSRLSPYLHFGEISPNQVWHAVRHAAERSHGKADQGAESFLREIGWREFSYHLLFHHPAMTTEPLRAEFARFPWRDDADGAACLAARRDGLPHRRCRDARAVADRLDAEPRAHDRRLVPGEAPARAVAGRRRLVPRHAGRRRPCQQFGELAVGRGMWRRCRALFPHLQPRASGSRNSIPTAPMCGHGCPSLPS